MKPTVTGTDLALPGRLQPTQVEIAGGQLTCLVGPNGSGKTSLLHALSGIGRPEGEVRIHGRDPRRLSPAKRARLLTYLPATREIAWPLTVRDIAALGLDGSDVAVRVSAALRLLELDNLAEHRIDRLSTGERSRALIARVLAAEAELLLLDEPTANLDPLWQLRLMEQLRRLAREQARTILVAIHDLEIARRYADRLLLMAGGRIVADGPPDEILAGEPMARIFGIRRGTDGWEPLRPPADPRSLL